jgi:hypothetical protein
MRIKVKRIDKPTHNDEAPSAVVAFLDLARSQSRAVRCLLSRSVCAKAIRNKINEFHTAWKPQIN